MDKNAKKLLGNYVAVLVFLDFLWIIFHHKTFLSAAFESVGFDVIVTIGMIALFCKGAFLSERHIFRLPLDVEEGRQDGVEATPVPEKIWRGL